MARCAADVTKHCPLNKGEKKRVRNPGETVHCLMRVAAEHLLEDPGCEAELRNLMREADVATDWKIDPVLQRSCQDVVVKACSGNTGPTGVLSCLMTAVATGSRFMTRECHGALMEIHYFLARDYSLDPKLYK